MEEILKLIHTLLAKGVFFTSAIECDTPCRIDFDEWEQDMFQALHDFYVTQNMEVPQIKKDNDGDWYWDS